MSKKVTCPDCKGTGKVIIKQVSTAGGLKVIGTKEVTCGACNGTGKVEVFDH